MLTLTKPTTIGTKLLCYSDDYGFTDGNEYTITEVNNNGYYVTDQDGIEVLFETLTELRNTFFIEGE